MPAKKKEPEVPVKKDEKPEEPTKSSNANKKYKYLSTTFEIAFVLPAKNASTDNDGYNALVSYYEGARMALDSLGKIGFKANIRFYNYQHNDSAAIAGIFNNAEIAKSDIVIGPLEKWAFKRASEWSIQKQIPVVAPFSTSYLESDNNALSIYFKPSLRAYAQSIKKLAGSLGKEVNVIFVSSGSVDDKAMFSEIKKNLINDAFNTYTIQPEVNIKDASGIKGMISKTKENLIIGWVTSDKHISQLGINLGIPVKEKITLVAPEDWLDYKNADHQAFTIWQANRLHVLSSHFIDKANPEYIGFMQNYDEKYNALPDEYALKGYDQMMFLGLSLATFGQGFTQEIPGKRFDVMDGSFDFNKQKVIENHFVQILEMVEYSFIKKTL